MAKTVREQLAGWVRAQLGARASVSIPQLTNDAVAHFAADPEFVQAFLQESFRETVYIVAQNIVGSTRSPTVLIGDEVMTQEQARAHFRARRGRWQAWLEYDGSKHVRLTEMTRRDLLQAAEIRERRGRTELALAKMFRALARKMDDEQTVGEVYGEAELEQLALAESVPDELNAAD